MYRTVIALGLVLSPIIASAFQAEPVKAPGEWSGTSVAGSFSAGLLTGEANEHVFDYENPDGSRRQLSRLDWDLSEIFMAGGQVSVTLLKDFSFNGGFWSALTEGNGEMDDYDWLDVGSSEPTHYSLSEVDVTEGYIFDFNGAYEFYARQGLSMNVLAGYKQNGWTWTDRGVYLLYPEYGPDPVYVNGENMIDYEQEFKMPYLGLNASLALKGFSLSAYLNYSPMVTATDWDHHIARTIYFKDTFEDGGMLGAGAKRHYPIKQNVFCTAAIDYQSIDLIVGDMEALDYSTGELFFGDDAAGIENEYTSFSVGLGCYF